MTRKISVEGMTCNHCAMRVEKALKEIPGVKAVKVDLQRKLVTVDLDDSLNNDQLKASIEDVGYNVTDIK